MASAPGANCTLGAVEVPQVTPAITWVPPTAITYGTALSATQLDAMASVPGAFSYTPGAGTALQAGTQKLAVTFTPVDQIDYAIATNSVSIIVNQANPVITWVPPGCHHLWHRAQREATGRPDAGGGDLQLYPGGGHSAHGRTP